MILGRRLGLRMSAILWHVAGPSDVSQGRCGRAWAPARRGVVWRGEWDEGGEEAAVNWCIQEQEAGFEDPRALRVLQYGTQIDFFKRS